MASRVLIVDDDPVQRRRLEQIVSGLGHEAETAATGEEALARLMRAEAPRISALILDLVMPDLDGMAVLERLSRRVLAMPVIVQVEAAAIETSASAMRAGASDFLVKPAAAERVQVSLANALRMGALEGELSRIRMRGSAGLGLSELLSHMPSMQRVRQLGERAARCTLPVLIEGERGVGKESLARAIHAASPRRNRPFVAVGCADGAALEVERLLFGGDPAACGGKLQEANGGTLFLDDIGALPPRAQERLAEVFPQSGPAEGLTNDRTFDIRLLAATARRLVDLVSGEGFRADLFYRLNVLPIWMPPLRERKEDIRELARSLAIRFAAEERRPEVSGISADAMELLLAHDWPGNVRELENAMFRAVTLSQGGELSGRDFPQFAATSVDAHRKTVDAEIRVGPDGVADQKQAAVEQPLKTAFLPDRMEAARYGVARLLDERGELRPFDALEREVIRFAIDHYRGHMSEVARRLGIGRSTLYRKIKDYGIASHEVLTS